MQIVAGNNTFDFYVEPRDAHYGHVVGRVVQTVIYTQEEPMLLAHSPEGSRNEWREKHSTLITDLELMEIMGNKILPDFIKLPKTYPVKTLDTDRARAAEAAYHAHSFGDGVTVHAYMGWDRTSTGSRWSRDSHASSAAVAMSIVKFSALFELGSDKIIEAYALDRVGREWGSGFALDPSKKTIHSHEARDIARSAQADKAFEKYVFGDGVTVQAVNGWSRSDESMSRAVFVTTDDDESNADSTKLNFTVVFGRGGAQPIDVYAIDRKGSIWGAVHPEGSESADVVQRAPSPAA